MNNLLKAALVPTLARLAERTSLFRSAAGGIYAGVDVTRGQPFAGTQARLSPEDAPVQIVPSAEGNAPGTAGRWQANADAQVSLAPPEEAWRPYAGGGLCLVGGAAQDGWRPGVNLIGGLDVDLGPLDAFVQARLTLADGVHLSLTAGARPASGV